MCYLSYQKQNKTQIMEVVHVIVAVYFLSSLLVSTKLNIQIYFAALKFLNYIMSIFLNYDSSSGN